MTGQRTPQLLDLVAVLQPPVESDWRIEIGDVGTVVEEAIGFPDSPR